MQHAADAQHHFRVDDLKIMSRESDWHKKRIRESVYIRALSTSLNRNEGRYILAHCYNSLNKKNIKKPAPPEPPSPKSPSSIQPGELPAELKLQL